MNYGNPIYLLLAGLFIDNSCWAVTQSLNLELLPTTATTNRLNISVSTSGLSDSELTRVSGNALATIDYELFLGAPLINAIEFTGGTLSVNGATTSDVALNLGNFIAGVDIVGSGLSGTLDTPSPPGPVENGSLDLSAHLLQVNSGTLDADGRGLLGAVDQSIDLTQTPLELVTEGTAALEVTPISMLGREQTYLVTLTLPVDATETITEPTTINVDAVGTLIASDMFSVTLPIEGDFNGDQRVDLADYTVWRDALATAGPGHPADGNFDWVVDQQDYALWQSNFSSAVASGRLALQATVPEPASLCLAAVAVAMLAGRYRRPVGY